MENGSTMEKVQIRSGNTRAVRPREYKASVRAFRELTVFEQTQCDRLFKTPILAAISSRFGREQPLRKHMIHPARTTTLNLGAISFSVQRNDVSDRTYRFRILHGRGRIKGRRIRKVRSGTPQAIDFGSNSISTSAYLSLRLSRGLCRLG